MAKLNVVIPAADVEVIGKDGARTKYQKVERNAQAGDIIRITDIDAPYYVQNDAFYGVVRLDSCDDPQIRDEDGDEYDAGGLDYEVYEKVTETHASASDEITFEGAKYRRVDRSAEEGDVIKITALADEDDVITMGGLYRVESLDWAGDPQITDDGGDDFDTAGTLYEVYEKVAAQYNEEQKPLYKEVKRPAKVGERIKIVKRWSSDDPYENGDTLTVTSDAGVRRVYATMSNGRTALVHANEYVVLEPIESAQPTQPKRLTVGDYAKVIADRTTSDDDPISSGARVGDIVEVVEVDDSNIPYGVMTSVGANVGDMNWAREWALEYVDKAEFLAQKAFKVGDYVKVTDACGAEGVAKVGDIGEVTNENWSGGPIGDWAIIDIKTLDGREYGMYAHRFVRAKEAEIESAREAAKQALKYGDFMDGDYAQIVDTSKGALSGFENGDYVAVERYHEASQWTYLRATKGRRVGYCNQDALRKVTREEYEAAADPRSQFAKGDKVRLISGGGTFGLFDYETGEIYTVSDPKPSITSEKVQITGGGQLSAYARPDQLEKVSAEEIAEIERKKAEESKWRAIGRKVGEFKRGDIVKVIRVPNGVTNGHKEGAIGEVVSDTIVVNERGGNPHIKVSGVYSPYRNNAVIIVPVEQRFDREQVETAQAA